MPGPPPQDLVPRTASQPLMASQVNSTARPPTTTPVTAAAGMPASAGSGIFGAENWRRSRRALGTGSGSGSGTVMGGASATGSAGSSGAGSPLIGSAAGTGGASVVGAAAS